MEINTLTGVSVCQYANLALQAQNDDQVSNAMKTCQEYAVIAYWLLVE